MKSALRKIRLTPHCSKAAEWRGDHEQQSTNGAAVAVWSTPLLSPGPATRLAPTHEVRDHIEQATEDGDGARNRQK